MQQATRLNKETCVICQYDMTHAFEMKILNKYLVQYFSCSNCGHLRTETPYWLSEAYDSAIAILDTGILERNLYFSKKLAVLLYYFYNPNAQYIDYAGGTGIFVRSMRDIGFDFYWNDQYCDNAIARGFEAKLDTQSYAAFTAFEVIEHLEDPMAFIKNAVEKSDLNTLIFSTQLFHDAPPDKDWWYYAPTEGQHISFFQRKTLKWIANKFNLFFYSAEGIHILTSRRLDNKLLKKYMKKAESKYIHIVRKKMSPLTITDHNQLLANLNHNYE